ncbi:MAG TPA: DUF433 domain-containing protein [Mycobacteriales bacterium]|nr:DUF433 domain-containing protein [Mycobacteriales bacterium]
MAYGSALTAELTGATTRQLGYWRNGTPPVLEPEISRRPLLYSFRDLLALRTVAKLRTDHSLQGIRRALDNLRDLGNFDHLSRYRLVGDGRSIALVESSNEAIDLLKKPGQEILVKLSDVVRSFETETRVVPDLRRPRPNLRIDPKLLGGFPVAANSRVPYDVVAELVLDGVEPDDVHQYYPTVSADAARDAADFALQVDQQRSPQERRLRIA